VESDASGSQEAFRPATGFIKLLFRMDIFASGFWLPASYLSKMFASVTTF